MIIIIIIMIIIIIIIIKLKVHRENSQTILYHVTFSRDTVYNNNTLFVLFFFGLFCFTLFFFSLF